MWARWPEQPACEPELSLDLPGGGVGLWDTAAVWGDGQDEKDWGLGKACSPSALFTQGLIPTQVAAPVPPCPRALVLTRGRLLWRPPPQNLAGNECALHRAQGCTLGAAPALKVCSARGPHRAVGAPKLGLSDGLAVRPSRPPASGFVHQV